MSQVIVSESNGFVKEKVSGSVIPASPEKKKYRGVKSKPVPPKAPAPVPDPAPAQTTFRKSQGVGTKRAPKGPGVVIEVAEFLGRYMVLPRETLLVTGAWVVASWVPTCWDNFPHLAVTSPEKRCGKTRFLSLLEMVARCPYNVSNISPAAIYRLVEKEMPTLLLDEAQSVSRKGSESSQVVSELLNAAIARKSKVIRCSGNTHDPMGYGLYCPKVIALIGALDGVLADRCLPVRLERKKQTDVVEFLRSRTAEPIGKAVADRVEAWTTKNAERLEAVYDAMKPFPIPNERMAELLMPLQSVLTVLAEDGWDGTDGSDGCLKGGPSSLEVLRDYAFSLDGMSREQESRSPGVILLNACREIFLCNTRENKDKIYRDTSTAGFMSTACLIAALVQRKEEPWATYSPHGTPITERALAVLLATYEISPGKDMGRTVRGYYAHGFRDAWSRYLPPLPLKNPSQPSQASKVSRPTGGVSPL